MYLKGWQENTTHEDVAAVLTKYGATDVVKQFSTEFPEFTWTSYVDDDRDVLDALSIMLWYNDRSDESIATIRARIAELLVEHKRKGAV